MIRKITYNALRLMPDQKVLVKDNECAYFRLCQVKINRIYKNFKIYENGIDLISIEDEFCFQYDSFGKKIGEPFEVFVQKGKK